MTVLTYEDLHDEMQHPAVGNMLEQLRNWQQHIYMQHEFYIELVNDHNPHISEGQSCKILVRTIGRNAEARTIAYN